MAQEVVGEDVFLANLQAAAEVLVPIFADREAVADEVLQLSSKLRSSAENLVTSAVRQGSSRQSLELELHEMGATLDGLMQRLNEDVPLSVVFSLRSRFAESLLRGTSTEVESDETAVTSSADWPHIAALRSSLKERSAQVNAHRSAANFAAQQARSSASSALRRSPAWFRQPISRPTLPSKIASIPMVAFLVVAATGIAISPTSPWAWGEVIALTVAVATSLFVHLRKGGSAAGSNLTLGAGTSLAAFTALYILSSIIDPNSIVSSVDGLPVQTTAEQSLLALSVAATVGPIGLNLSGLSRVIAFVELLVTIAAVGAVLAAGWRRLAEGRDGRPPTEGQG